MKLIDLVRERPVISKVLSHYLHNTTSEYRELQDFAYTLVCILEDCLKNGYKLKDSFSVWDDFKIITYISAQATLNWLSENESHEWYQPILRLLQVLDDKDVPPEPLIPPEVKPEFLEDGTYLIRKGCHVMIEGQFCTGDLIAFNWKKNEPVPQYTLYGCQKCGNVKTIY
jgi:hypothetical protein